MRRRRAPLPRKGIRNMEPSLRATLTFSAIGFLVNFGVGAYSPILPLYALTFNVSLAMVGALIAASGLSKVILDMPAGLVADRLGTKRFMMAGLVIVTSAALLAAFAPVYGVLLLAMVLQGAGSAIYFTTSYLGISRTAPPAKRGAHLSVFISLQFLGSTSGPILGGLVGQSYGLGAPFLVYAALTLTSVLVVKRSIPGASIRAKGDSTAPSLSKVLEVFQNYTLVAIDIGLLATSVLRAGVISTIIPLFATANLGLSPSTLGGVLTLSAAFNFLALLPAGALSDRYGRRPFLFASLFLSGVTASFIPFSTDIISFAATMCVLGFTLGLSGSIGAYVTDVTPPADLGASMGIFRTIGDVGSFIGPLLLTSLLTQGMGRIEPLPFIVAGLILISSSLLLIKARDPVRHLNASD